MVCTKIGDINMVKLGVPIIFSKYPAHFTADTETITIITLYISIVLEPWNGKQYSTLSVYTLQQK
jgi:hypothetical protein